MSPRRFRRIRGNRPIAPHLKDRIKDVEWEDLDPDQYPDLFRAIGTSGRYSPGTSEDIIQRNLKSIIAGIADKAWVFRRAKLSLVGHTHVPPSDAPPEPYWIAQYGPNDVSLNNPKKSLRCEPKRGGGDRSNLELYIVSEAKQELTKTLSVYLARPSSYGQHLKIIDNRLFVENINPEGFIELSEVDIKDAVDDIVCNFVFEKSK